MCGLVPCRAIPIPHGILGVDIFFVISGYLVGGVILRETKDGWFDFANFYARRARRILPAVLLALLTSCLAWWFLLIALPRPATMPSEAV